jgi:hypothetical protein
LFKYGLYQRQTPKEAVMATNPDAEGCGFIEGKNFPIAEKCIQILDNGFTRSDRN